MQTHHITSSLSSSFHQTLTHQYAHSSSCRIEYLEKMTLIWRYLTPATCILERHQSKQNNSISVTRLSATMQRNTWVRASAVVTVTSLQSIAITIIRERFWGEKDKYLMLLKLSTFYAYLNLMNRLRLYILLKGLWCYLKWNWMVWIIPVLQTRLQKVSSKRSHRASIWSQVSSKASCNRTERINLIKKVPLKCWSWKKLNNLRASK